MSAYKSFISAAKSYFGSNPFLKFLLASRIFIFAAGGIFFLLGLFIVSLYESFVCIGSILMWAGLLLSIVKEDVMTIVIASGVISLGSLIGWILGLIGVGRSVALNLGGFGGFGVSFGIFLLTPLLYFLIFGTISIVVLVKAEKFRAMRAATAAARPMGVPCPRCGVAVPFGAAFCPACGNQVPQPQYYAPQYAAPQTPPYAPQPTNFAPPQAAPAVNQCASCGTDLPADAIFCGKCGAKQG